jgi:hypothetical protein
MWVEWNQAWITVIMHFVTWYASLDFFHGRFLIFLFYIVYTCSLEFNKNFQVKNKNTQYTWIIYVLYLFLDNTKIYVILTHVYKYVM